MTKKIISDKRVGEVIFGFADYADIYFEKDDPKVYDDDDEEPYMDFFEEHYEECIEGLIEDKTITRSQGNYLLEAEHDDRSHKRVYDYDPETKVVFQFPM
ncbi:MAG TPA: hypothetical protein ENI20_19230 [Bacteroides sp.]|nr:hypothetical protein [Bacteroides sp.]